MNAMNDDWDEEMLNEEVKAEDGEPERDQDEDAIKQDSGKAHMKGKAKAKPRAAKAKAGAGGSSSSVSTCSCPSCENLRKGHSKYCERHKRNYDNMLYQRSRNENEEERKAFDAAMANMVTQAQEVEKFGFDNPGDSKYKKQSLIQWSRFTRQYGQRTEQGEVDRDKPYTKEKFKKYCTDVEGLTEEESKSWWKMFYDNPAIERDNSGPFGREVLYLPLDRFRERKRVNYIDVNYQEGSKELKNASAKDRAVLRQHVQHQEVSHAHEFLRGAKPDILQASGGVASNTDAEAHATSLAAKAKRVDLERDLPRAYEEMRKTVGQLETKFNIAFQSLDNVLTPLNDIPMDAQMSDRALMMFLRTLQFRAQLGRRWQGDADNIAQWLLPDGFGPVAPATPAPAAAAATAGDGHDNPTTPNPKKAPGSVEGQLAAEPPAADSSPAGKSIDQQSHAPSKSSASVVGIYDRSREVERLKKLPLLAFMQENRRGKVLSGDFGHFITCAEMHSIVDKVLDQQTAAEYLKMKGSWMLQVRAATEVATSITKAIADVKSHISIKTAESKRAAKRKTENDEKAAMKKARDEATAAAAAIKKQKHSEQTKVKPIFSFDFRLLFAQVPKFDHVEGDGPPHNWGFPFMRSKSEAADLWAGDPQVQRSLTTFGGQYKRGAGVDRAQFPFEDATSLEKMNVLLETDNMKPPMIVDIQAVPGGASFQDSAWMFGYTPEMKFTGLAPNCASIQRWLVLGGVHIIAVELVSLVKHMAKLSKVGEDVFVPKVEEVQAFVESWDEKAVRGAMSDGVVARQATLEKKTSVFIPLGWLCVERSMPNHPLVYGARKSFMTADVGSVERYELLTKMYTSSGRAVVRMEQIHELMKAACVT